MSDVPLQPAFRGFLKASGTVGEGQLGRGEGVGWQGRTNVSTFSSDTLIGNWNEERFDVSRLTQPRPLPSQYDHYFETTYRHAYSKSPPSVPEVLRYSRGEEPKAFPAHQPQLDPPQLKQHYNSFLTSSTEAYLPPPLPRRARAGDGQSPGQGSTTDT